MNINKYSSSLHTVYNNENSIKRRTPSFNNKFDFSFARSLDLFPKAEEASVIETSSIITTVITLILIFILSIWEFTRYVCI